MAYWSKCVVSQYALIKTREYLVSDILQFIQKFQIWNIFEGWQRELHGTFTYTVKGKHSWSLCQAKHNPEANKMSVQKTNVWYKHLIIDVIKCNQYYN